MLQILITMITIVLLEMLLSLDNSIVISMIANKAAPDDRPKVIKYGIWGAFILRGLSVFLVSWLLLNPEVGGIFKILGGAYLIHLGLGLVSPEEDTTEEGNIEWLDKLVKGLGLSLFWLVIVEVEVADLIFSLDNLLATVALAANIQGNTLGVPNNILFCIIAIFLGIIVMRFVTVAVMKLVAQYPGLNQSAGWVILLLGVKLIISALFTFADAATISAIGNDTYTSIATSLGNAINPAKPYLDSHMADYGFSFITIFIFIYPILHGKAK